MKIGFGGNRETVSAGERNLNSNTWLHKDDCDGFWLVPGCDGSGWDHTAINNINDINNNINNNSNRNKKQVYVEIEKLNLQNKHKKMREKKEKK